MPSLIKMKLLRVGCRKIEELGALRRLTGASWWQKLIKITDQWQDGIFFDNSHKFKQKHVQKNGMKSSNSSRILRVELSGNVHGLAPQFHFDVDYLCFRRIRNELDIGYISVDNLTFFMVLNGLVNFRQWTFVPEMFSWLFFLLTVFVWRPILFTLRDFMILLF